MAEGPAAKTCTMCGCDCAAIPRAKDRRGRYFCRPCYDKALAKVRAKGVEGHATPAAAAPVQRRAVAAGSSRAVPPAGGGAAHPPRPAKVRAAPAAVAAAESDPFADLLAHEQTGTTVETERPCPSCGVPVAPGAKTCEGCGFDLVARKKPGVTETEPQPAKAARSSGGGGGFAAILGEPLYIGLAQMAVMLALGGAALARPALALPCAGIVGLYGLGIGIWTLVTAFQESVGTGLLCLCVPVYALYFVYSKCDNANLRWSYGAAMLGNALTFWAGRNLPGMD